MFHKLAFAIVLASAPLASASHLRPRRNLQSSSTLECTILVGASIGIDASFEDEEFFSCEMDPEDMNGISGITLPIQASTSQKNKLKEKLNNGQLVSGKSTLKLSFDTGVGKDGVHIPPGLEIAFGERRDRRNLAVLTGEKPILVVKVIDNVGLQRTESLAQIGDDIFGTLGDPENLKSQMAGCSFDQLNIVPGNTYGQSSVPGTIEVTINVGLETAADRYEIHNAVTAAVQSKLGVSLPGPYHQVMYVLEKCYVGCGWAAYAYVNSWMSVYQNHYYKQSAIQMHEIGHNFGMAHSGGIDGATYTDHTGAMGNPCYSDDGCKICFNAAKNWYLGWYDDKKITVNPLQDPTTEVNLVGIADYANNPNGLPVIIKIETGSTTDQYIGFNRARGVNINNDEADDEVTITETGNDGTAYSQSFLKAHLLQGESYEIANWAGSGETLYITATKIDQLANPWYATVAIRLGSAGCTTNSDCDDGIHCNGAETCNLSTGVCQAADPFVCDNGLFCDGVETCVEGVNGPECVAGTDPCDDGLFCTGIESCNEDTDTCVSGVAIDCDDGIFCNGVESCVEGADSHVCQSGAPPVCPDDGNVCNGVASCDFSSDKCVTSPAVDCSGQWSACGAPKICQSSTGLCVDGSNGGQDGICGPTEDFDKCPQDCTCGNGFCDNGEDFGSCPGDCTCGNGNCDVGEDSNNCPGDCPVSCPICSWTGQECCGTCVTWGKKSDRGCQV